MKENNKDHSSEELQVLEGERELLLDHNYDGIHELNYPLPSWWMKTWALTIVFSIAYVMFYHFAGGPSSSEELARDMVKINEQKAIAAADVSNFDIAHYNEWKTKNDATKIGNEVYETNCFSCHATGGGGDIGPNLTDGYWIHLKSRTPEELFPFIRDGFEDKGMPAWGEILSKEEIYAAINHIMELKGTTPPKSKEPQGEKVEE
ncbi:cbb3-type cytochrome c oxidase N-terminal domain-containing protein [Halobacteriovorax sp. JY17]|uniref:cbb3-type cytochrome c oxidase N-terminal domain-containing protein n=1 Tax=Halobacteriovorax sp. JY17 TaxID=2014617 RepID=UPI0025C599E7|nr:cbb3-type cytochrome c oxidase N-terminal domain-containing protein [Halobacteriovorax sp. JY17]